MIGLRCLDSDNIGPLLAPILEKLVVLEILDMSRVRLANAGTSLAAAFSHMQRLRSLTLVNTNLHESGLVCVVYS